MLNWLRGLALLRHPELVRDLGERRFHLQDIESIRHRFPNCRIDSDVTLNGFQLDLLTLRENVSVCSGTVLSFGDDKNGAGRIQIGAGSWIGQYNNFRAGGGDIQIGTGCLISQFCTLVASNHGIIKGIPIRDQEPDSKRRGVGLGDGVWLGAGVTILPGVTIGNGAVIGAGSVVTGNVPDEEVWFGVPACHHAGRR